MAKASTPEARAARDALLNRAQWIIDNNIRAACGLAPLLPKDLVDFAGMEVGPPSVTSLNVLLKSVMPAMDMKDDHRAIGITGDTAVEQATSIIDKMVKGEISLSDADSSMLLIKNTMEIEDRAQLTSFLEKYSEKHNIQLKSFG